MKNLFTLFLSLAFMSTIIAQSNVVINMNHKLGNYGFQLNDVVTCNDNYDVKLTRLEYYISQVELIHDGGQTTMLNDQYFLIRANEDGVLDLGEINLTTIEGINFSIGVDEATNHLDPTTYPASHALAPKNPSMHWGWASGYRFVAIEGKAGMNTAFDFEVHALGDNNYKTVNLMTEATTTGNTHTIEINADYLEMFNNINVSNGLIVHGSSGKAITLMNNFQNSVFSAAMSTNIIDPIYENKFQITPNPSSNGMTNVQLELPNNGTHLLTVTDIAGRVIQSSQVSNGNSTIEIHNNNPGIYFIHLWKDGAQVAFEKWVVNQ